MKVSLVPQSLQNSELIFLSLFWQFRVFGRHSKAQRRILFLICLIELPNNKDWSLSFKIPCTFLTQPLSHTTEGWQKMSPQNMSLWRRDYFERRGLEKQQMQVRHSNLTPFFLKTGKTTPMWKLPHTMRRETFFYGESWQREFCPNRPLRSVLSSFVLTT